MIRSMSIALCASLICIPAQAQEYFASLSGEYALDATHCGNAMMETNITIDYPEIRFWESACMLENETNLRDMPEAKLFDKTCMSEGMFERSRVFIGIQNDGLVMFRGGRGYHYVSC